MKELHKMDEKIQQLEKLVSELLDKGLSLEQEEVVDLVLDLAPENEWEGYMDALGSEILDLYHE